MIIFGGQNQTVVPQRRFGSDVERAASFPTQIGIVVARFVHCHHRRAVDGHHVDGHQAAQRIVGRNTAQIAGFTITDAKFQTIHDLYMTHEGFILHIPLSRHRGEESPGVVLPD